jgi:hypothetical protein
MSLRMRASIAAMSIEQLFFYKPLVHANYGASYLSKRTLMRTANSSPALLYARVFGVVLTLAGIIGLMLTTSQNNADSLLGLDVNLTHNLVHLITGILGLAAGFSMIVYARSYALVLGVVYTALGVWGLFTSGTFDPFGLFVRINTADNFLHLAIGIVGLAAYAASRSVDDGARLDDVVI